MLINLGFYHLYYYYSNNNNLYNYYYNYYNYYYYSNNSYNYYYNYYYYYYYYFLNKRKLNLFLKGRVEKRKEKREEKNEEKREEKNEEKIDELNKNLSKKEKIKYLIINLDEYINKLINSKIGLYNAGGSCYMASIIQILIHSKVFLEEFLKIKNNNRNSLTYLFGNFIKEISNSSFDKIEISKFAEEYNKINNKFNGYKGNNPMTFFNEFIKKLGEENNENILKIYSRKKKISFKGIPESDYEEDFIFNLVNLDQERKNIKDALEEPKQLEDDDNIYIWEEITEKPKILIINLEGDKIRYKIEEKIYVGRAKYNLKAINRYTNYHSIA